MSATDIAPAIRMFLEVQPWKLLDAGAALVFALEEKSGEKSYAVLMSRPEGCSLVLCRGERALSVYAALVSARCRKADEMEIVSLTLEQNCLEFRLGPAEDRELNEWLDRFGVEIPEWSDDHAAVLCRETARLPRLLDKEEQKRLAEAICAAVDYAVNHSGEGAIHSSERLGDRLFIPCAAPTGEKAFSWSMIEVGAGMAMEFPSPCLQDELALRRLKKKACSGHEFACALRLLPMLLDEKSGQVPCVMLMVDSELSMIGAPVAQDADADASALAGEFLRYVEEFGRPACIRTGDPRSYCLLHGLAGQLGIRMEQAAQLPQANEAMRQFMNYMLDVVQKQNGPDKKDEKKTEKKSARKDAGENQGICIFCEKEFSAQAMEEHIGACARAHVEAGDTPYFLLKVTCPMEEGFWMYLEVKRDTSLRQLDQFLRDRWLECCGHESAFLIHEEEYYSACDEPGMKGMSARLCNLVEKGDVFLHQYDFGTPTDLEIEVADEYEAKDRRKKVVLAAQNIMPKLSCVRCGRPAKIAFRPGLEPLGESVFCEACAQKEEIGMLPLLNSPRTGVCGYGLWMDDDE